MSKGAEVHKWLDKTQLNASPVTRCVHRLVVIRYGGDAQVSVKGVDMFVVTGSVCGVSHLQHPSFLSLQYSSYNYSASVGKSQILMSQ